MLGVGNVVSLLIKLNLKNPLSIANEIPSVDNLPYLCMCNGQVALKRQHHQYFAQVQGEMAITKRPMCYFFVYIQKAITWKQSDLMPHTGVGLKKI